MRPRTLLGQWQCRWRCPPSSVLSDATASSFICLPFAAARSTHHGNVHYVSRALKLPDFQMPSYLEEGDNNSSSNNSSSSSGDLDSGEKKSRNQKKREARRAVRWGMELASFSPPQIKRVLRVASLEREVFDALMLVKRLGPDVREGKRRQYNYIGKLLREVEPELMDSLIHATKDGDWSRIEALSVSKTKITREDDHDDDDETDYEVEDEDLQECIQIASRWFDGLANKDPAITNEVYATQTINFDRQELRKLVRKMHAVQECDTEENGQGRNAAVIAARKSLTRFLRVLAKQMSSASNHIEL